MGNCHTPGPVGKINRQEAVDAGTLCRHRSPAPGIAGLAKKRPDQYSYAISGKVGALGGMLFTAMSNRLPGTLYDRTYSTTQYRLREAQIGLSGYGDADARKSASRTLRNIRDPAAIDVDVHFDTADGVENITVRGNRGMTSFRFDFNKAQETAKNLPPDADAFKPFNDKIDAILLAVKRLR